MKKEKKFRIFDLEHDVKYRGPLSYRHLRILGWFFLVLAQIAIILGVVASVKNNPKLNYVAFWFNYFSSLTLPLFLLANFSFMLRAKTAGFKKLLITYGGFALLIFILYIFVTNHYLLTILTKEHTLDYAFKEIDTFANSLLSSGVSLNIFIDLLLCTLLFFFLNYIPKKHFKNEKLIIFRLFSLIPIIYEAISIALRGLIASSDFNVPSFIVPLLTNKPPLTFVAFVCIVLFIKVREIKFIKKGHTLKEYHAYLQTNRNSLDISIATSIIFGLVALIDLLVSIILNKVMVNIPNYSLMISNMGFGKATTLFLAIPFIMLFSYTREHKNQMIDLMIPIIGVGILIFTYLEGFFIGLMF